MLPLQCLLPLKPLSQPLGLALAGVADARWQSARVHCRAMAKRRRKRKSEYVRKQRRPSVPGPATGPTEPPWRHLWTVLAAAFAARAAVALGGEFILHADEVMQYLEPAHWLVFGNGVLHWEFFYGARSWLVPSAVAAVLFLCQAIGLDSRMVGRGR